jgi:hypothetical protein
MTIRGECVLVRIYEGSLKDAETAICNLRPMTYGVNEMDGWVVKKSRLKIEKGQGCLIVCWRPALSPLPFYPFPTENCPGRPTQKPLTASDGHFGTIDLPSPVPLLLLYRVHGREGLPGEQIPHGMLLRAGSGGLTVAQSDPVKRIYGGPISAARCALARFQPLNDGAGEMTGFYIYESCVEEAPGNVGKLTITYHRSLFPYVFYPRSVKRA